MSASKIRTREVRERCIGNGECSRTAFSRYFEWLYDVYECRHGTVWLCWHTDDAGQMWEPLHPVWNWFRYRKARKQLAAEAAALAGELP